LILVFATLFTVFLIGPAMLGAKFTPYPLIKLGDVLDLFTPLILMPIYWMLFQIRKELKPGRKETILFLVIGAAWAMGQGMHLAANSIGHQLTYELEGTTLRSCEQGMDVCRATIFYDEELSHIIWYAATFLLSGLLIWRQWRTPFEGSLGLGHLGMVTGAGLLHGLTFAVTVLEARTVFMGFPFAGLVVTLTLLFGRKQLRKQPILFFFFVAYALACLLFAGWGIYHSGFPEPLSVPPFK
jgi:hypothetical protein